jgi:inorganic pyrophosphatase
MNEDSPQNPAVIADNVGDNVGDIAGMGADLFGSFAESSCAAMVIAAQSNAGGSNAINTSWPILCFPMIVIGCGIFVCVITSFFATHVWKVNEKGDIEPQLKWQLGISTFLMTPVCLVLCYSFFPSGEFSLGEENNAKNVTWAWIFACLCCGLWSGLIIGIFTERYTSNAYPDVQHLAESCRNGASTNIIYGLALGYKSVIVPIFCLAITIYIAYDHAGMYGIAMAAIGILSTLPIGLTIDAYGPICDNAGGIAEMTGQEDIREITDDLDAAGNTTAAIGKGFAIGSAALVSLALFGAFVTTVGLADEGVDILQPKQFAGLLIGAMLPYWFSAMTMKSVGMAAQEMNNEVRRQFAENPRLLTHPEEETPDYNECIRISTESSLKEMVPPGVLVMGTPIIVGFLFGREALAGILAGQLVSGVQIAISASNTGGAWDNAKKHIESGQMGDENRKGPIHDAAVVGDTVGDPLKDTSGPALNILVKLSAIISLVLAPAILQTGKDGEGLLSRWGVL